MSATAPSTSSRRKRDEPTANCVRSPIVCTQWKYSVVPDVLLNQRMFEVEHEFSRLDVTFLRKPRRADNLIREAGLPHVP